MTRTFAALALIASTALAAPAMAGGLTLGYSAKNQDEANLMRLGMAVYVLGKDHKQNGGITQNGVNNALSFITPGNNAIYTEANGNGHSNGVAVSGNDNKCAIVQHGNGHVNNTHLGGGETCIVLGIGFD